MTLATTSLGMVLRAARKRLHTSSPRKVLRAARKRLRSTARLPYSRTSGVLAAHSVKAPTE